MWDAADGDLLSIWTLKTSIAQADDRIFALCLLSSASLLSSAYLCSPLLPSISLCSLLLPSAPLCSIPISSSLLCSLFLYSPLIIPCKLSSTLLRRSHTISRGDVDKRLASRWSCSWNLKVIWTGRRTAQQTL
jgi:hypothetical protein